MPIPSVPSGGSSSAMGSPNPAMFLPQDGDQQGQGEITPTSGEQQREKQSSFIAHHKELMEQLQAMAQSFPEFAPATRKMMEIAKRGLVEAIGAMSRSQKAERIPGSFAG